MSMQEKRDGDFLQAKSRRQKKGFAANAGLEAICRVPLNHRQAERIVIKAVQRGELEIDLQGRVWRVKTRRGLRMGGSHSVNTKRRRVEHKTGEYLQVRVMENHKRTHATAHRLVWQFFFGNIPLGACLNHKNGIKIDNRPENLEVVSYAENLKHAFRTGLKDQHGELNPAARLTDNEVVEIRTLYATRKFTFEALGKQFATSPQTISKIVRGERRTKQAGPISRNNPLGQPGRDSQGRFVGKKAAGRLLDGVEHNEYPGEGTNPRRQGM